MLAVQAADCRDQFTLMEWVSCAFGGETLIISDDRDEKAVLLSIKEFNELKKEKERAEYLAKLDRGIEAIRQGNPGIRKTMEELEAMADE